MIPEPVAAVVKVTDSPTHFVALEGWAVIPGATLTVSRAELDVAVPSELVKTARYLLPFSAVDARNVRVVDVSPFRLEKVVPPSMLTCH